MNLKSVALKIDHTQTLDHDFVRHQVHFRFRFAVRNRIYIKVLKFVEHQFGGHVCEQIKDDIK